MKIDGENLAIVRHAFADAALSHKVQETAAGRKAKRIALFKIVDIGVFAAALGLFAAQSKFLDQPILAYVGTGLTVAAIVLRVSRLTFGVEQEVAAHKNSAIKYRSLRDRYKSFLTDIASGNPTKIELIRKRDSLLHEYQMIADLSLQTSEHDYHVAMKKMKLVEDGQNVWSDEQIDSLLPKELRTAQ